MTDLTYAALAQTLEREASLFTAHSSEGEDRAPVRWLVADLEFIWDRDLHRAYRSMEGVDAERKIHWPFHRLAAVSWLSFRFLPGWDVPEITGPVVLAADETSERHMAEALFEALKEAGNARLVSWGGEARDNAVLRHAACRHGLVLPVQLRDTSPHARGRLDLCRSIVVQADPVNLPEYAVASSIPAKPSPAKEIGAMAERGEWKAVRDHVLGDVLTTSVVALRHLAANAAIVCDHERSVMATAEAALAGHPGSEFVTRTFRPWARDRLRAAGLRGTVYRGTGDWSAAGERRVAAKDMAMT